MAGRNWTIVAVFVAAIALARPARADDAERLPYRRGQLTITFSLGGGHAGGRSYLAAGGHVGYHVLPGLEVGLGGIYLVGTDPAVAVVSPDLRYVLYPVDWPVRPFVGAFYRYYFLGDYGDKKTAGGTLGILWRQRRTVIGLGLTVERVVSDCSSRYDDCTRIYPYVSVSFPLL